MSGFGRFGGCKSANFPSAHLCSNRVESLSRTMYGIPEMSMLDERTHARIGSFAEDFINPHGQIESPDFDPFGDDIDPEEFERMGHSDSEDSTQTNIPPQIPLPNPLPLAQPSLVMPNLPQPSQSMVAQQAHVNTDLGETPENGSQGSYNDGLVRSKCCKKTSKPQNGGPTTMTNSPNENVTASVDASIDPTIIASSAIPSSSIPVYYPGTSANNAYQDANKASSREHPKRRG